PPGSLIPMAVIFCFFIGCKLREMFREGAFRPDPITLIDTPLKVDIPVPAGAEAMLLSDKPTGRMGYGSG
ncbi:MAG: hypothetical protein ACR2OX_01365, partial [Methyloligellaceae bacterium]